VRTILFLWLKFKSPLCVQILKGLNLWCYALRSEAMFSYAHTMISFPFIEWAICLYNKGVHFQLIVTHNCVSVCPCGWTECLSSSIVCREVEETWSYNWPGGSHGCRIRQHSIVLASAVLLICWQRPHVHCTRYKSWAGPGHLLPRLPPSCDNDFTLRQLWLLLCSVSATYFSG
jgi:hypothetical protein